MPSTRVQDVAARFYARYTRQTGNKNYQGLPCPEWHELPQGVQQAWIAVADESAMDHPNYQAPHPEVLPPPIE